MKVKPISPDDVKSIKPWQVIETFNELIQEYWDDNQARIKVEEAVDIIAAKMGIDKSQIYHKHYLDIEPTYYEAGWDVTYHKPDYDEREFEPYFIFTKKREKWKSKI